MWNRAKDFWFLFGRLFPFPTKPGLREIGQPDASSPVLVTCNFELTVRMVANVLTKEGIDAWLLVAPTKGINVWCAAAAGHFTTDTVVSIIRTTGIEEKVNHRRVILPQLSASGVNFWALKDRTGWKPRFGPADVRDLPDHLRSGRQVTEQEHRNVRFDFTDRFIMGTNLGFNSALLLALPLLLGSIWLPGLWWKTMALILCLSVMSTTLVHWLPGKIGVQKGLYLGLMVAAPFVIAGQAVWDLSSWPLVGWTGWLVLVSMYTGYDVPSWSPLWRQDPKELILGRRTTHVEIIAEKCINCHLCAIVCPVNVFDHDPVTEKYAVARLPDCEACGACIENCPTDAIVNNFRGGTCSCPTCLIIEGVGSLAKKHR